MSDGYDSDPSGYAEEPHPYAQDPSQGRPRPRPRHSQGYDRQGHYVYYSSSSATPRNVDYVPRPPASLRGVASHEEEPNYKYSSGLPNSQSYDGSHAPDNEDRTYIREHAPGFEAQYDPVGQAHSYEGEFDNREEVPSHEDDQHYQPRRSRPRANTRTRYASPTTRYGFHRGSSYLGEVGGPVPGHPMSLPSESVLDPRYMVQLPQYYREGKVFSILWHENDGRAGGTLVSRGPLFRGRFGEPIYSTIRRMVVFRQYEQCSWCFAITTYNGRGVAKRGVNPDKHAIVYMRGTRPTLGPGEPRMIKEPLEVAPETPDEHLDPMSRLNFSKIYTVEHNVKVLPIGQIPSRSMIRFREYARYELAV
ncbi:hypothetical protein BDW66DRAFT_104875 [Aspergillus desertorum]